MWAVVASNWCGTSSPSLLAVCGGGLCGRALCTHRLRAGWLNQETRDARRDIPKPTRFCFRGGSPEPFGTPASRSCSHNAIRIPRLLKYIVQLSLSHTIHSCKIKALHSKPRTTLTAV